MCVCVCVCVYLCACLVEDGKIRLKTNWHQVGGFSLLSVCPWLTFEGDQSFCVVTDSRF